MTHRLYNIIIAFVLGLAVQSCFTGVEGTRKITDKDVQRALEELERGKHDASLTAFTDSLPAWKEGKEFWVVDEQAKLIFLPIADCDLDSLQLEGTKLAFTGFGTHRQLDNSEVVDIYLSDGVHRLTHSTGKSLSDVSHSSFSIPFLVDADMVRHYAQQLEGKTVWVKTSIWLDAQGDYKTGGRKFVPVVITAVKPGNRVYPLRVEFCTEQGDTAMLWMTTPGSAIAGRDFDALFSMTDVRKQYSKIANDTWSRIVDGKVVEGMTKEECQLSLGAPKRVSQLPDQSGLREYWYYDGGRYLFFVDGLLKEFR